MTKKRKTESRCWTWPVLALATLLASPAAGQQRPPPEMAELGQAFRVRAQELNTAYRSSVEMLPRQYEANVAALRERSQKNGDLDGVLAAHRELERYKAAMAAERDPFEETPEMPATAIVESPAELKQLQQQYVAHFKESAATRMRGIRDLTVKYIANLQKIQADLTRAGRIAEAVTVKSEADRLQQGLASDNLMSLVERMVAEQTPGAEGAENADGTPGNAAKDKETPLFYGSIPDWARWKYTGKSRFARERTQYKHPDLPDELFVRFNEKTGQGNFSGRCSFGTVQIGVMLCHWFGQALIWQVDDPATLSATFVLTSRHISAGEDHGPAVQVAVLANGQPLRAIDVNLSEAETTLRLVKDPNSSRCALMWPRGQVTETFELPEGAKLGVLLGVTVRNPGELCDTSLTIR